MLEVQQLHAYYGRSHIVQGVDISVQPGEAVGLLGRNGVGKSTTLKSIMGIETRTRGGVAFQGADIGKLSTHARSARGIGYVPEERAIFPQMTVEENVRVGALIHRPKEQAACLDTAFELFPILRERRRQVAGTLSGGQQKMLALARALALAPRLLLVDEPTEGLMPVNVELITAALVRATRAGIGVLVVDASFGLVEQACSRLYVMDRGTIVGEFQARQFSSPEELAATYLGKTAA